ncbi:MAG: MaoC family dehydratase N-terminal domain-containing protein [Tuberibacillus sp.]
MLEHLVGKISNKVLTTVERGAVKKFAEAIGESHPIYTEREYGLKSKYGDNIAPPTFPRTFDYGTIDGLQLPSAGLIHGEQSFDYTRPLVVGESLYCYTRVENYIEKETKTGSLGFLTLLNIGEDENNQMIFQSKIVIILTEKVREAMRHGHHTNT